MSNFTPDNISYIDKDFQSIYNELLELAPKLTDKWDPNMSNESDPLVVLLKLSALLSDKIFYNIDKNILELYPQSVTQRGNAQKIYESLGYNMKWYNSAVVNVNIRWIGKTTEESNDSQTSTPLGPLNLGMMDGNMQIPFRMVTDSSKEIIYTIIPTLYTSLILDRSGSSDTACVAMEGALHDFEINGEKLIKLQNLDSNLRLYFVDSYVAENGVFIKDGDSESWTEWELVDNLEATQLNRKVYKFGVLPNTDTCYIEFPQDIANLIKNGIYIKYITSSGVDGAIKSNTLEEFYDDIIDINSEDSVALNDSIRIWNPSASSEGYDPEGIDEAYRNWQKFVNTFNTLITCKDYENALFRSTNDVKLPLFSNCVVSDRTNDLVSSIKVQTLTLNGPSISLVPEIDEQNPQLQMNAFNLKFYLLDYPRIINDKKSYDQSFTNVDTLFPQSLLAIDDYKAVQHDVLDPAVVNGGPYLIKNKFNLVGKVITYNKVSEAEARNIEANIAQALYKAYNAREINFGEEPDYSEVIDTIKNADKRIRDVILNDIEYTPYLYIRNKDSSGDVQLKSYKDPSGNEKIASDFYNKVKAKNILAGVTQGIEFDDDFNYEFNQINYASDKSQYIDNIKSISAYSSVAISIPEDGTKSTYTTKDNESVVFFTPNLVEEANYGGGLYYTIPNGKKDEDSPWDEVSKSWLWSDGEKFNPPGTITLSVTKPDESTPGEIKFTGDTYTLNTDDIISLNGFNGSLSPSGRLIGSQTITKYKANEEKIPIDKINGVTNYIALLNSPWEFSLSGNKESSFPKRFLQDGEYFITTNASQTEIHIFSSGTTLEATNTENLPEQRTYTIDSKKETSEISEITSEDISDIEWDSLPSYIGLKAIENSIVTIGGGVIIQSDGELDLTKANSGAKAFDLKTVVSDSKNDNLPKISYGEDSNNLTTLTSVPGGWYAYSTLNIIGSKDVPMKVSKGQRLEIFDEKGSQTNIPEKSEGESDDIFIQFNSPIAIPGGDNVDMGIVDSNLEKNYTLKAYIYKKESNELVDAGRVNGYLKKEYNAGDTKESKVTFKLPLAYKDGGERSYLIPVFWVSGDANSSITYENLKRYSSGDVKAILNQNGAVFLLGKTDKIEVSFSPTTTTETGALDQNGSLYIGRPYKIENDASMDDGFIKGLDLFDYTYKVTSIDPIEDPASAEGLFDPNNVFNRFTIAQIDNIDIKVANQSKLQQK